MKSKSEKLYLDREMVPEYGNCDWFSFLFSFTHFLNLCLQLRLTGLSAHTALQNVILFFYELSQQKRERKPRGGEKKKQTKALFRKCPESQTHPLVRGSSRCRNFPSFTQDEGGDKSARGEEASALFVCPGPFPCSGRVQTNSPTRFCLSFFLSLSLPPSPFVSSSLSFHRHTLPVALGEK